MAKKNGKTATAKKVTNGKSAAACEAAQERAQKTEKVAPAWLKALKPHMSLVKDMEGNFLFHFSVMLLEKRRFPLSTQTAASKTTPVPRCTRLSVFL